MLEQSDLSVSRRRANVRSDAAAAILTERGWRVYRASYPRHGGDVSVFCRKADNSQGLNTRILLVKAADIDARLASQF